jgi:hypothetical protein
LLATVTGTNDSGEEVISFIYKDAKGMPGVVESVNTGLTGDDNRTTGDKRNEEWNKAIGFVNDPTNADRTYEELRSDLMAGRDILSEGDIETILADSGKKEKREGEVHLTDKNMESIVLTYALSVSPEDLSSILDKGVLKINGNDTELSDDQISSMKNIMNNSELFKKIRKNPDDFHIKYNSDGKPEAIMENRQFPIPDKKVFEFK